MKNKEPKAIPTWNPPDSYKAKLTLEDLKFLFEQSEKLLNSTVEESDTITDRNNTLLNLVTALLVALFGYSVTQFISSTRVNELIITSAIGATYLFIGGIYTFYSLLPKTYLVAGSPPADNFNENYFQPSIPDNDRIRVYYMNEIVNYKFKIDQNGEINKLKWKRYKKSVFMLIAFPPLISIIYFLLKVTCLL